MKILKWVGIIFASMQYIPQRRYTICVHNIIRAHIGSYIPSSERSSVKTCVLVETMLVILSITLALAILNLGMCSNAIFSISNNQYGTIIIIIRSIPNILACIKFNFFVH